MKRSPEAMLASGLRLPEARYSYEHCPELQQSEWHCCAVLPRLHPVELHGPDAGPGASCQPIPSHGGT